MGAIDCVQTATLCRKTNVVIISALAFDSLWILSIKQCLRMPAYVVFEAP